MRLEFDPVNHVYRVDGEIWPSVTQVLTAADLIDTTWYTEESRVRGTFVAHATALDDAGQLDRACLDRRLKPYCDAWRACCHEMGWSDFAAIERPFASPVYRVCGTEDRVWKSTCIDIKTGNPEDWHGVQLVPYADYFNCTSRVNVYLSDDGKWKVVPRRDPHDRVCWTAAVNLFNWKKNHGYRFSERTK